MVLRARDGTAASPAPQRRTFVVTVVVSGASCPAGTVASVLSGRRLVATATSVGRDLEVLAALWADDASEAVEVVVPAVLEVTGGQLASVVVAPT